MTQRIAIILPAYQAEEDLPTVFARLKRGAASFPHHDFALFPIDDTGDDARNAHGDKTWEAINDLCKTLDFASHPHQNSTNKGLVQTLKDAYQRAFTHEKFPSTHTLKTDADKDFHQERVITSMVPYVNSSSSLVAGVRWRKINVNDYPGYESRVAYELHRRADVLGALERELDVQGLDPASCGTQLYEKTAWQAVAETSLYREHNVRWGLDLLVPLIGQELGHPLTVENIEDGVYDPERRPSEKIQTQYDRYVEIIAKVKGTQPEMISNLYNKGMEEA